MTTNTDFTADHETAVVLSTDERLQLHSVLYGSSSRDEAIRIVREILAHRSRLAWDEGYAAGVGSCSPLHKIDGPANPYAAGR